MPKPTKILVIEDQQDARTILKWQLVGSHFDVVEASDGAEAAALAKQELPDLIISDLMMPKQDGLKFYTDLRQDPATREIPVLFLSVLSGDRSFNERSLELMAETKYGVSLDGRYGILGKPYELPELLSAIQRLLTPPRPARRPKSPA